ncbi:hypothetical protein PInf_014865 [Phytophthora infestans]|nr:hypothetical protein PInf_014865 [Phytophthora infestans]
MLRSWWMACKVTFAEYLPNVLVDTKDSAKRYWNASWEASRATLLRCYGVGEFVCWVALLCLSLLLFVPINLYDLVEFVLQGPIGVAIGLMLLVTYDYCYEWTRWDLLGPLIVVVTGVISHALRLCEGEKPAAFDGSPECAAEEDAPTTEAFLGNTYGTEQSSDHPIDLSGVVPGAGGQAFVPRDLGEGQRAATVGGWFPLTPQAPTHFAHGTGEVMV